MFQGIAFRKADAGFHDAAADALSALIADGSYGRIMAKWGRSGNAVLMPVCAMALCVGGAALRTSPNRCCARLLRAVSGWSAARR